MQMYLRTPWGSWLTGTLTADQVHEVKFSCQWKRLLIFLRCFHQWFKTFYKDTHTDINFLSLRIYQSLRQCPTVSVSVSLIFNFWTMYLTVSFWCNRQAHTRGNPRSCDTLGQTFPVLLALSAVRKFLLPSSYMMASYHYQPAFQF
jgi:hypothetical protein